MTLVIFFTFAGVGSILSATLVNVALNKPAVQIGKNYKYFVNKVNDGLYYYSQCLSLETDKYNFWIVDFLGTYTITSVKYLLKGSGIAVIQAGNFTVHLSEENPQAKTEGIPQNIPGRVCFSQENNKTQTIQYISCTEPITGRYLILFKPANATLFICEMEALATTAITTTSYLIYAGQKSSRPPFNITTGIPSSTMCIFYCQQATGGVATAIQHRKQDGECECLQISGFDHAQLGTRKEEGWDLYCARNN